jgi:hypothetical protein
VNVLQTVSPQLWIPGIFLSVLTLTFLGYFLVPGYIHWFRLKTLRRRIAASEKQRIIPDLKAAFQKDRKLEHLWNEYRESLHYVREERDGQMVLVDLRSTVPADMFFNAQYVVDGRLRTEFFKHLPGIYTGIGIIGTFYGLIVGLSDFHISEDPNAVRGSLESLMHHVGLAFEVSGVAIGVAMLVTFLEKWLLSGLYRKTEEVAQAIDAKFVAGAGEEYLSRLVRASEDSASQSKILKDALVKELGDLLRDLTNAQISAFKTHQAELADRLSEASRQQSEAARQDSQSLGTTIATSIEKSLQGPLETIANTVKAASGDQSATAARMMQDVMVSFSQRLNDIFGGQISGLSDLNRQTAQSIQSAVASLQALVSGLEEASRKSTASMAERMAQAVEKMEARQEAINAQSQAFVEQIRSLVASSQSETNLKLQATLENIGTQVGGMLKSLNDSQQMTFESHRDREEQMAARTSGAVGAMSESVEGAVKEISAASALMAKNVEILSQSTASSVDKMSSGADALNVALGRFTAAGDAVSGVLAQAGAISSKLAEASGALTSGSSAMQELIRDYQLQRTAIATLVVELRATVESSKKEATLTADVLNRIQGATERLAVAQKQADEYLDGVSRVLGEAHSSFATEVKRTLDKANSEFHTKLTTAVGMLSSSITDLSITLEGAGAVRAVGKR